MTASTSNKTIVEQFNARFKNPIEVARTFVAPDQFQTVAENTHTLLVGPRGSGKTTLLKMLTLDGLRSWEGPEAQSIRNSVDYTGVFIQTDVAWSEQIKEIKEHLTDPIHVKLFCNALFTAQSMRRMIIALADVAILDTETQPGYGQFQLAPEKAIEFCKQVSSAWHLEPTSFTMHGLKLSLSRRLVEIPTYTSVVGASGGRSTDLPNYLHLPYLSSLLFCVDAFSEACPEWKPKCALLLDELELAPLEIQSELIRSMRSSDERTLFKLSISPSNGLAEKFRSSVSANPEHDYKEVPLWYARKADGANFSERLFQKLAEGCGLHDATPEQVFGRSMQELESGKRGKYGPRGDYARIYTDLAERDPTFRKYLERHDVDLMNMDLLGENRKASSVRKMISVVAVRETYFKVPDRDLSRVRSRKNPQLYTGAKAMFEAVEGNPRWLIHVIGGLLTKKMVDGKVDPMHQAKELERAASRFRSLIKIIPSPFQDDPVPQEANRGMLELIDKIGDFFFQETVRKPFTPEPALAFKVHASATEELLMRLTQAVNIGAVILVTDDVSPLTTGTLQGKTFRLSYLLAPFYKIPMTLGECVNLASILYPRKGTQDKLEL